MAVTIHDTLTEEDLDRWRQVYAEWSLLQKNAGHYDREEAIAIHKRYYELTGELHLAYDIPVDEAASICPYTGTILVRS